MTMTVEGPGGISVDFPDGTDHETINKVMSQAAGGNKPFVGKPDKIGLGDVGMAALRGVPVVGGLVERFSSPESQAHYKSFDEQNPMLSSLSKAGGGVASMFAPLGLPGKAGALAARGLGLTGETVGRQVLNSALSGGAIGAADAVARGTDPEQQGMIGAATGAAGPIVGRAVGAGARAIGVGKEIARGIEPSAVKAAGSAMYKAPEIADVQFKPNVVPNIADDIIDTLNKDRRNARLAPSVHDIIEDMKTPIQGGVHTIEDLETTRRLLGEQAGKFTDPTQQAAATIAIKKIDKALDNIKQGDLLRGDAQMANAMLKTGRANYALGSLGERVGDKVRNAELRAASSNSGGNTANATRQNLRTLLTSKSQGRGLTDEDIANIESAVRPSPLGGAIRSAGNLLGGGGGLGMLHTGALGAFMGGPIGAVGVPALGYAMRKAGEAMTSAKADRIIQQILARSPEGQKLIALRKMLLERKPLAEISNAQTGIGLLGRSIPAAVNQ